MSYTLWVRQRPDLDGWKEKMVDSEIADFIMATNRKFQDCRHRGNFRLDPRKWSQTEQVSVVQGND